MPDFHQVLDLCCPWKQSAAKKATEAKAKSRGRSVHCGLPVTDEGMCDERSCLRDSGTAVPAPSAEGRVVSLDSELQVRAVRQLR